VTPRAFEGVTELTIMAQDHPRLLSVIAGACYSTGANIVDAQIDTTTDGFALDTIFIGRELPGDDDERRRGERITALIERTLRGDEQNPGTGCEERIGERPDEGLQGGERSAVEQHLVR
jgi:[protein-PII] uridylyltransferase